MNTAMVLMEKTCGGVQLPNTTATLKTGWEAGTTKKWEIIITTIPGRLEA